MSAYSDLSVVAGMVLACGLIWFWIWRVAKKEGGK